MLIDISFAWIGLAVFVLAVGGYGVWLYFGKPSRRAAPMAMGSQWVPDANWCMRFARRLERPISLVRISLPHIGSNQRNGVPYSALEQTLMTVGVELRCTDLIEVVKNGSTTFNIYCLDTDKNGANTMAARLDRALSKHGLYGHIAVQTFPEDGYTLNDLDQVAARQLHQEKNRTSAVDPESISAQQA
jgi:hypothetical protein